MTHRQTEIEVQDLNPGQSLFNQSFDIIKESLKDIKQEMCITLEDGSGHIVYVHDLSVEGNQLTVDFSTLSEERKAELTPHVHACLQAQFDQGPPTKKKFAF